MAGGAEVMRALLLITLALAMTACGGSADDCEHLQGPELECRKSAPQPPSRDTSI